MTGTEDPENVRNQVREMQDRIQEFERVNLNNKNELQTDLFRKELVPMREDVRESLHRKEITYTHLGENLTLQERSTLDDDFTQVIDELNDASRKIQQVLHESKNILNRQSVAEITNPLEPKPEESVFGGVAMPTVAWLV